MRKMILFLLLCAQTAWGQTSIPEYFQGLYVNHLSEYKKSKNKEYKRFCEEFNLYYENQQNQKNYFQILFIHDLFTGSFCIDFTSGGVLKIPYVFHWKQPNPRHSITMLSRKQLLSEVVPPDEFKRYKTFADIDRVPSLYIGDLFSIEPRYYHPKCGKFYTFGWCSEHEMAYNAILTILGYSCKIKQKGIHTWSEVWLPFIKTNSKACYLSAMIDNSVDIVKWEAIPKQIKKGTWLNDYGAGTQINWYNKIARSDSQLNKIRAMTVTQKQTKWIEKSVIKWLDRSRKKRWLQFITDN